MATLQRTLQPACPLAGRVQTACAAHPVRQTPQKQRRRATSAAALPPLTSAAALADVLALPLVGELQPWVLPAAGLGVAAAGIAAIRLSTYSQLEYITAAMLARHVKAGGARVLQLGGSTRDIFYYPAGTIQVTVGGPDLSQGLWEQAGMQAKVPVQAVKAEPQKVLSSQAGSTADSIVLLNQLQEWADMQQLLSQAYRVLKPGGTLIFVQRLRGGPLQPLLGGSSGAVDPTLIDQLQDYAGWDFVQVDAALRGSDLHAIGVAVKPLTAAGSGSTEAAGSVDTAAFEALMRRGKGKRQQQQAGGFQKKS